MGVDTGGAGDQGLMFGFGCDEPKTDAHAHQLAHRLTQRLAEVRKSKKVDFLRPMENPKLPWSIATASLSAWIAW